MGAQVVPVVAACGELASGGGGGVAAGGPGGFGHRPRPPGWIDGLGPWRFPQRPAHKKSEGGGGLQPQSPRGLQPPPPRAPRHREHRFASRQRLGCCRAAGQPQLDRIALAAAAAEQRIGDHFAGEATAGGQGFKFEALQVELGEVQGQQPQPQHQEAQQQRSIALALDRHEQQQAAARQPEQAEAGRQDVEAAQPQP